MRRTKIKLLFSLVAGCLLWPATVGRAQAPLFNSKLNHVLAFVRTSECSISDPTAGKITDSTPLDTLLFESRKCNPILAPDGHQLNLGEFLEPTGRAAVKCLNDGTHTVLTFHGLVPNATYTVWMLTFKSPGFDGSFFNLNGVGSLGPNDGSGNFFTTDSDGSGALSAISPAGTLSKFGSIPACWLPPNVFEVHLVGVYHIDGKSHGTGPGPAGTFVEQLGFMFTAPPE